MLWILIAHKTKWDFDNRSHAKTNVSDILNPTENSYSFQKLVFNLFPLETFGYIHTLGKRWINILDGSVRDRKQTLSWTSYYMESLIAWILAIKERIQLEKWETKNIRLFSYTSHGLKS